MAINKYDGATILEETVKNAKCIQELLNDLCDLAPDHLRDYVDMLKGKIELRMFYQDYLYDVHGTFTESPEFVLDYTEYEEMLKSINLIEV